jgi:hypothetical protein
MATCLTRTQPTLFVIGPKPVRRSLFAQSDRGSSFSLLFGVDDLISLVVQPAPAFAKKMEVYRARVTRKACQRRWPKLRIMNFTIERPTDSLPCRTFTPRLSRTRGGSNSRLRGFDDFIRRSADELT